MREIKFRFWDIEQPYMMSWDEAQEEWETDCYTPSMLSGDHWIPMEFTGLKDSKGVDIYEGDILKICNGSINGIPWMAKNRGISYKHGAFNVPHYCIADEKDLTHWCEVIGNIHENPELLEVKE